MKYLKLYSKNILIMTSIFLILTLLVTLLSYFDLISDKLLSIFEIIIMIVTLFTGGFLTGMNSSNKGWLEGIKIGLIFIILFIIINILFIKFFQFKNILYYLILLVTSCFGGMIGILKK